MSPCISLPGFLHQHHTSLLLLALPEHSPSHVCFSCTFPSPLCSTEPGQRTFQKPLRFYFSESAFFSLFRGVLISPFCGSSISSCIQPISPSLLFSIPTNLTLGFFPLWHSPHLAVPTSHPGLRLSLGPQDSLQ